jgi:superfamily II DNA/RNA helicase
MRFANPHTGDEGAPGSQVLFATDAAGDGINLRRAHLMVNYDLPWNPNRIEQRFGRIHRAKPD